MTAGHWIMMLLAAGIGAGHIVSERRAPRGLAYLLKPAPIVCLMLLVAFLPSEAPPLYRGLVVAALLLSAVGDVMLLDSARFTAGLVAFLFGHLVYIAAFFTHGDAPLALAHLAPLVLWGGVAFWLLRPGLGALKTPVLLYICVLMTMIWTATEFAAGSGAAHARLAAAGAVVFGVSDTLLAMARFRRPFPLAQPLMLSTYYAAQILIAASAALWVNTS